MLYGHGNDTRRDARRRFASVVSMHPVVHDCYSESCITSGSQASRRCVVWRTDAPLRLILNVLSASERRRDARNVIPRLISAKFGILRRIRDSRRRPKAQVTFDKCLRFYQSFCPKHYQKPYQSIRIDEFHRKSLIIICKPNIFTETRTQGTFFLYYGILPQTILFSFRVTDTPITGT